MEMIDARRALELLTDVVDSGGDDYVYPKVPMSPNSQGWGCRYEFQGKPSCMVGHALVRAGVEVGVLADLDRSGPRAFNLPDFMPFVSPGAAQVFDAAQTLQDNGKTWGVALDHARTEYEWIKEQEAQSAA